MNTNRATITAVLAGTLLAGICAAQQDGAGALILADEGQTAYQITIAPAASTAEKTAARELAAYLTLSTNAEFAIVALDDEERVLAEHASM